MDRSLEEIPDSRLKHITECDVCASEPGWGKKMAEELLRFRSRLSVQGEELPELELLPKDFATPGEYHRAARDERERQLRSALAEIGRLKGERDAAYRESTLSGDRLGERYEAYCDTNPKPMMTFSGWLNKRISDAETAEGEREAYRILMNEARAALSASRSDALKEASECASSYFGHEGWGEKFRNAGNAISAAILARMEKAS